MEKWLILLTSTAILLSSCHKDSPTPNTPSYSYVKIDTSTAKFSSSDIQSYNDTCFYDSILDALIVQLEYNSVKDFSLGSQTFSSPFIISISIGSKSLQEKAYSISLPFANGTQLVESGHSIVALGGYIAKQGSVKVKKIADGKFAVAFEKIDFYSNPKDSNSSFNATSQIICQ
ncbi:MAG: hypothetical protein ABIO44_10975 [Saprospiraceae bacterium]